MKFIFTGEKPKPPQNASNNLFMFLHVNIQEKNSQFIVNSYTITHGNVSSRGTKLVISIEWKNKQKKKKLEVLDTYQSELT